MASAGANGSMAINVANGSYRRRGSNVNDGNGSSINGVQRRIING